MEQKQISRENQYALFDILLAAVASFLVPGFGQLFQLKYYRAIIYFLLMPILYIFLLPLALLVHVWAVIDALMPNLRFKNTASKVLQRF